jgi:hypothetical protein
MKIPLYIRILGLFIPILKWDDDLNLSKGEIRQFNFIQSDKNAFKFNQQVCSFEDSYEWIWRHIHNDYFKCIAKSHERTC